MSSDDTELLREFAVESQEHLADIENQLLTLESQGDAMDVALVNTVFRAIHSIKGAAGFMGLDTLGGLAHRAEEVLGRLRSKDLRPTSVVINTLLRATDRLKELIDEVENSNGQDVTNHIVALEDILQGRIDLDAAFVETPILGNETALAAEAADDADVLRQFLVESFDQLDQIERDLAILDSEVHATSSLANLLDNIQTIRTNCQSLDFQKLEQVAGAAEKLVAGNVAQWYAYDAQISESLLGAVEVVRKILFSIENAGSEGPEDHQFTVDFLVAIHSVKAPAVSCDTKCVGEKPKAPSIASPQAKSASNSDQVSTANPVKSTTAVAASASSSPVTEGTDFMAKSAKPTETKAPQVNSEKPTESKQAAAAEASAADTTIRVDVALLDKLLTRGGELVLARNQILQFNSTIEDAGLQNAVQRLNLSTSELQEGGMKSRMQPIGNVWTKFPR
ncbi:MAG TPA: hypothetical protein DCF63_16535, partial [Planctomycetaceae bacterium]|nr:hypothetical protein [Planctomycetaceae bacterium]